jgi:hypothetical protein
VLLARIVAVTTPAAFVTRVNGADVLSPGPLAGGVKITTPPGPTGSPALFDTVTTSGLAKLVPRMVVIGAPSAMSNDRISYAPMSNRPCTGRAPPRTSMNGASMPTPASMAGLPGSSRRSPFT